MEYQYFIYCSCYTTFLYSVTCVHGNMPTSKSVQLVHPRKEKKENFSNNIQLTMKGLQYSANAHGLCHVVFKHLALPQENTQKPNALGNSLDLILPFI